MGTDEFEALTYRMDDTETLTQESHVACECALDSVAEGVNRKDPFPEAMRLVTVQKYWTVVASAALASRSKQYVFL